MTGIYRRFMNLIGAASRGLVEAIPFVGPMLQAVLEEMAQRRAEMERRRLEEVVLRLSSLLTGEANLLSTGISPAELELDLSRLVDDEENAGLATTILLAEAEAGNRLARGGTPQRRFLYLAAANYASSTRTLELAAELGFLWRSYHADGGAAIAHVQKIRTGDLLVLAYRLPNQFRILLPLLVTDDGEHTVPVNDGESHCHIHAPFVLADRWLTQILVQEGYTPDPVFKDVSGRPLHSGLNVEPLLLKQEAEQSRLVRHPFPSPGMNTIWPHDHEDVPVEVRNWIARL